MRVNALWYADIAGDFHGGLMHVPPVSRVRIRLSSTWRLVLLVLVAAVVGQAVVASPAEAATASLTATITGAGSITQAPTSSHPYSCFSFQQSDAVTVGCPSGTYDTGVFGGPVNLVLVATPSATPAGHWRFLGWVGCPAPSGNQCTVAAPVFGNVSANVRAVFDDFIGPTISGLTATTSTVTERTASFTWSADELLVGSQCSVDGAATVPCSSGAGRAFTTEGNHTFAVRGTDQSGNLGTAASVVYKVVDTELSGGPTGLVSDRSPTFTFSTVAGNAFECSLDGAGFAACGTTPATTGNQSYLGLGDGSHTFRVRARNGSFVDGVPAVRTWTIDSLPPETAIDSALVAVDSRSANFMFSHTGGSAFQCALTGPSQSHGFVPCTSPRNYLSLADGSYSFQVRSVDDAGNVDPTPATQAWSIDLTAPQTSITGGPTNGGWLLGTSTTMRYASSQAGSTFACKLDSVARPCGGTSLALTGLSQASHVFTVAATDATGNADLTPASRIFTVPRNNTTLTHSSGWVKATASGYYLNTYSQTKTKGKTLTKGVTGMRKLSLVATKGVGYGTVQVYLGGTLLKTVSLNATSLKKKQVIPIASWTSGRTGTVKVLVYSSNKTVRIEGLGVATR
jgi:hypothetical protein